MTATEHRSPDADGARPRALQALAAVAAAASLCLTGCSEPGSGASPQPSPSASSASSASPASPAPTQPSEEPSAPVYHGFDKQAAITAVTEKYRIENLTCVDCPVFHNGMTRTLSPESVTMVGYARAPGDNRHEATEITIRAAFVVTGKDSSTETVLTDIALVPPTGRVSLPQLRR